MICKGQAIRDSQVRDYSFLPKSCQKCIQKNEGQIELKFQLSLIKEMACMDAVCDLPPSFVGILAWSQEFHWVDMGI